MRDLFDRVGTPLATPEMPGGFLAGRRLAAIDGACLDVVDTAASTEFSGRPASSRGEQVAFLQVRLMALAVCASHAVLGATVGACSASEIELARDLDQRLPPGMLALVDRGFYGFRLWAEAAVWRVKKNLRPWHVETLPDRSWLARIVPTSGVGRAKAAPLTVRVIDYTIDDGRGNPEEYRLLTALLDPLEAPAESLAASCVQRWEIESAFDELNLSTRTQSSSALEVSRPGATRDLAASVLPLSDPNSDG